MSYWDDVRAPDGTLAAYQAHSYLTNYEATRLKWNVPFWVGEFDEFRTNHVLNAPDMQKMMQYCKDNGLGWSYFVYDRAQKPLVDTHGVVAVSDVEILQSGFDPPVNQLYVRTSSGQLALSWPTSSFTFTPRWTASLNAPGWVALSQTPQVTNFQNQILIGPTNPASFFRLLHE